MSDGSIGSVVAVRIVFEVVRIAVSVVALFSLLINDDKFTTTPSYGL